MDTSYPYSTLVRSGWGLSPSASSAPSRAWRYHAERLRPPGDLHHRQGAALGRAHAAVLERKPVDLVLEHPGDVAVPLGGDPDLALGPLRPLAQLPHLRGVPADAVPHRQVGDGNSVVSGKRVEVCIDLGGGRSL